jgi:hypothetical protein
VSHENRRPLAHHGAQPGQDLLLGIRVHSRQRIVEDEDFGVDEERAREGGPLLLAARERDAAFPHRRLEAARKIRDVLVEPGHGRGVLNAALRSVAAERHVLPDGCREKERLLRHEADRAAKALQRNLADVHAADRHRAGRRLVQPRQQRDERRLAGPRGADERHGLP